MTRERVRGHGRRGGKRVFIFGEDGNDAKALGELVVALNSDVRGRLEHRMKPLLLAKGAPEDAVKHRAGKLAAFLRSEEARGKTPAAVFIHEDADGYPPEDETRELRLRDAAKRAGLAIEPVVPAWELEAWWFLFPRAVAEAFPSWELLPDPNGKRVDHTQNAKEALIKATGKLGRRRYTEADAPSIARAVRELGLAEQPAGRAGAYDRFRERVRDIAV